MARYATLSFALLLLLVLLPLLCAPKPVEAGKDNMKKTVAKAKTAIAKAKTAVAKKKKTAVAKKKKTAVAKKKKNAFAKKKKKAFAKKKKTAVAKKTTAVAKKKMAVAKKKMAVAKKKTTAVAKKKTAVAKKKKKAVASTAKFGICKKCVPGLCKSGLVCVRGLCITRQGRGAACAPPCRACKQGLSCRRSKCLEAASAVTIAGPKACGAKCTSGAQCQLGLGCMSSRCKKVKAAGERCTGACKACGRGTRCSNGTCVRLRAALCDKCAETSDCLYGLVCAAVKNGRGKVCSKVVPNHESCKAECVTCRSGVKCEGAGFCGGRKLWGQCKKCHKEKSRCQKGLDCRMTSPAEGRCVRRVGLGAECDNICNACKRHHLACRDGRCGPRGEDLCGRCNADDDCFVGLVCKKSASGVGRCAQPKERGSRCDSPCLACSEGLVCRDGETCDLPGLALCEKCRSDADCSRGHLCKISSETSSGSCAAPQIVGHDCTGACKTCHPGSTCSASGKCEELEGDWCSDCSSDSDCAEGLVCKDDKLHNTKKCARPMNAGQRCDEACWGCRTGLSCMKSDLGRKCVKRKESMCGACDRDEDCRSGLTCKKGSDGNGKCAMLVDRGANCADPCWACGPGLTCSGGHTCMPETVGLCEVCEVDGDCEGELRCKESEGVGRCASPMPKGERCGHRCWTCEDGLKCNKLDLCE